MTFLEAVILGLIQGLTEFLPVSSSGHIELGTALLQVEAKENLLFSLAVHAATALSTIIIFRRDIYLLILGLLKFTWNEESVFSAKIIISMIPVGIVGVLFEEEITQLFSGRIVLVGSMLIATATILTLSNFTKENHGSIGYLKAFIIGIAQAVAILPGISRSGATIGTALLLGVKREEAARFSFLMVLIPILGASALKLKDLFQNEVVVDHLPTMSLVGGFTTALITGLIACQWMLNIVKKGKLIYFAIYCFVIGTSAIISQFL